MTLSPFRRARLAWLAVWFAAMGPFAARAGCQIETVELPVEVMGTRAIATVGINGHKVPLVVDSGAFFSFLTEAAAAQLELRTRRATDRIRFEGITGAMDIRVTTVDRLDMVKGSMPHVEFAVGGNELDQGAMGVLGRNLLSFSDTEYDLANGVVRFVFPSADCADTNMAYWARGADVADAPWLPDSTSRLPAIRADALLNGSRIVALFDTGANTVVSLRAARRAGVRAEDLRPAGLVYGAGRGKAQTWTASFDRFELGGETVLHNRLPVGDFPAGAPDLLLGIDFFLSHRIYVSKQQRRVFFTYNGGRVFAGNPAGAAPVEAAPLPDTDANAEASSDAASETKAATQADAYARRGAASRARGELAAALADLDRACRLDPENAAYFNTRATIHQALAQPALALADFDTAVRLDPGRADARLQRAFTRARRGRSDAVLDDLAFLDGTLAPEAQMRMALAQLYTGLHLPARALVQWDRWIAAHPHDVIRDAAYHGRCRARLQLGTDLQKALDDCDEAVDLDSKNPAFVDSRGWVQLQMGRWPKALADFDRALALAPANASPMYGRGLAHGRMGDEAGAGADIAAARRLRPDIDAALARDGLPVAAPTAAPAPAFPAAPSTSP